MATTSEREKVSATSREPLGDYTGSADVDHDDPFWWFQRPLHGLLCGCGPCIMRPRTPAELEEMETLRKTVTVATHPDLPQDLYVGIELDRKTVARSMGSANVLNGWTVVEASVKLLEPEPGTTGMAYGADIAELLRQGYSIAFSPEEAVYLIGRPHQLLERGLKLPNLYVARQEGAWIPASELTNRSSGGKRKMTTEEKAKEKAEKKEKTLQPCACGCGTQTGSKFAMGHDSKLRGKIHRVLEGAETVKSIPRVAFERCGSVKVLRFDPASGALEEVEVPDAHFNHAKGQDAKRDADEKAARKVKAEAEKAEAAKAEAAEAAKA